MNRKALLLRLLLVCLCVPCSCLWILGVLWLRSGGPAEGLPARTAAMLRQAMMETGARQPRIRSPGARLAKDGLGSLAFADWLPADDWSERLCGFTREKVRACAESQSGCCYGDDRGQYSLQLTDERPIQKVLGKSVHLWLGDEHRELPRSPDGLVVVRSMDELRQLNRPTKRRTGYLVATAALRVADERLCRAFSRSSDVLARVLASDCLDVNRAGERALWPRTVLDGTQPRFVVGNFGLAGLQAAVLRVPLTAGAVLRVGNPKIPSEESLPSVDDSSPENRASLSCLNEQGEIEIKEVKEDESQSPSSSSVSRKSKQSESVVLWMDRSPWSWAQAGLVPDGGVEISAVGSGAQLAVDAGVCARRNLCGAAVIQPQLAFWGLFSMRERIRRKFPASHLPASMPRVLVGRASRWTHRLVESMGKNAVVLDEAFDSAKSIQLFASARCVISLDTVDSEMLPLLASAPGTSVLQFFSASSTRSPDLNVAQQAAFLGHSWVGLSLPEDAQADVSHIADQIFHFCP